MRRLLTGALLATVVLVSGCGGEASDRRASDAPASAERDAACAAGKGNVEIVDVLPEAPPGLELVEADPEFSERVAEPMRQAMGPRLRDIETRAVVPRDAIAGTGFIVVNFVETGGPSGDAERAARDVAAKNPGTKVEELSVAGAPGVLVTHPNGDMAASFPLGDCAQGHLFDHDRERILSVAKAVRPAPGP